LEDNDGVGEEVGVGNEDLAVGELEGSVAEVDVDDVAFEVRGDRDDRDPILPLERL
jgi:hypothetical protein